MSCALWAGFVLQGPWLAAAVCGLAAGALGGLFHETLIEGLVLLVISGFLLWVCQHSMSRMPWGIGGFFRWVLLVLAALSVGKVAGAVFFRKTSPSDPAE